MNIKFQTKVITTEYPKKYSGLNKDDIIKNKKIIDSQLAELKKLITKLILKID